LGKSVVESLKRRGIRTKTWISRPRAPRSDKKNPLDRREISGWKRPKKKTAFSCTGPDRATQQEGIKAGFLLGGQQVGKKCPFLSERINGKGKNRYARNRFCQGGKLGPVTSGPKKKGRGLNALPIKDTLQEKGDWLKRRE